MMDYEKRAELSREYSKIYSKGMKPYKKNLESYPNDKLVEKFKRLENKSYKQGKHLENDLLTYLYGSLGGYHNNNSTKWTDLVLIKISNGYGDITRDRVFLIDSIYYLYMLNIEIEKWIKEEEYGRVSKVNISWFSRFMDWI